MIKKRERKRWWERGGGGISQIIMTVATAEHLVYVNIMALRIGLPTRIFSCSNNLPHVYACVLIQVARSAVHCSLNDLPHSYPIENSSLKLSKFNFYFILSSKRTASAVEKRHFSNGAESAKGNPQLYSHKYQLSGQGYAI